MEIWHTQGRKGSDIFRSEWMLQTPQIQLTQMHHIKMWMLCKVLQNSGSGSISSKPSSGCCKSKSGSSPCRSNP